MSRLFTSPDQYCLSAHSFRAICSFAIKSALPWTSAASFPAAQTTAKTIHSSLFTPKNRLL